MPPPSTLLLGLKHVSRNEAEKKQNGHKQQKPSTFPTWKKSNRRHPEPKKQSENQTHFWRAYHRKPTVESRELERVHCSLHRKEITQLEICSCHSIYNDHAKQTVDSAFKEFSWLGCIAIFKSHSGKNFVPANLQKYKTQPA